MARKKKAKAPAAVRATGHIHASTVATATSTGGAPTYLTQCEMLTPRIDCDVVYYDQLLELRRKADGTPITHPCDAKVRYERFIGANPVHAARMRVLGAVLADRKGELEGVPLQALVRTNVIKPARRGKSAEVRSKPPSRPPATQIRTLPAQFGYRPGLVDLIREIMEGIVDLLPNPQFVPEIGLRVVYRQEWCTEGYTRGRLVRSIPLTADSKMEVVVKSWRTRKERREQNESVAEDISTEFIGDQKWSLATSKEVSANLSQSVDANLKGDASVKVPVKAAEVGGGVGGDAGSKTTGGVNGSVKETQERIRQTTVKAASSLKKSVTSAVETADETGLESTVTETIVNPNKCQTLTYHFFQVDESFDVRTRVDAIEPVLLLPIPMPAITPAWVLCHECLLRKYLPCETYYAGFEAAKRLEMNTRLGAFQGDAGNKQATDAVQAILDAIDNVIAIYHRLRDAQLDAGVGGGGDGGGGGGNPLVDGFNSLVDAVQDGLEEGGKKLEEAGEAAKGFLEETGKQLGGLVTSAAPQGVRLFSTAPGAVPQASTAARGGIGSYIYWQVLKIVAPQIDGALGALESSARQLRTMDPGAARVRATYEALDLFFRNAGDINDAFRKIDVAIFFLLAGTALAALGGMAVAGYLVVAVAAIIGAAFSTVAMIAAVVVAAATFLGAAAVASLTALGATLAAVIADRADHVDLTPDDEGLKAGIQGLYGLFGSLSSAIGLPTAPQEGASPEAIAAYERAMQEMKREQKEAAEAAVEFERLKCYLVDYLDYFAQLVFAAQTEGALRRFLEGFGVPPTAVAPRVTGFVGYKAAFRVVDMEWLAESGFDFEEALAELEEDGLFEGQDTRDVITMPTPGIVAEPALGQCPACDDFIRQHRVYDLELKAEEVAQAKAESERRRTRLTQDLLEDPVERTAKVAVSVEQAGEGGGA